MGIHRSALRRRRREDSATTKLVNRKRKISETARRRNRMFAMLRERSAPYAPAVLSWLSRELKKPAKKINQDDINALLG